MGGQGQIDGAQVIKGLWRIYPKSEEARMEILSSQITLRGTRVDIYDTNPYIRQDTDSHYVAVHDLPLSYSNQELEKRFTLRGFTLSSDIKYQYAQDENKKLTSYKTGSHLTFIKGPIHSLPEKANIGLFTARIWSPNQTKTYSGPKKCSNCLQEGHLKSECVNQVVCLACKQPGHRRGECRVETSDDPHPTTHKPKSGTSSGAEASASQVIPSKEKEIEHLLQLMRKSAPQTKKNTPRAA